MSTELLELATGNLGELTDEMVFIGGATIHLWITEPTAPPTRATEDVDVICDVASLIQYYRLGDRLREQGFSEDPTSPVICRWRHRRTGLVLDVMPIEDKVLGFSNPWYPLAVKTAMRRVLPSGTSIRAVAPAVVVATKLAAWKGRGKNDVLMSLDLHDVLTLIDGRPELPAELAAQSDELQSFVSCELQALLGNSMLDYLAEDVTRGYGQLSRARAEVLIARCNSLVESLTRELGGRNQFAE